MSEYLNGHIITHNAMSLLRTITGTSGDYYTYYLPLGMNDTKKVLKIYFTDFKLYTDIFQEPEII